MLSNELIKAMKIIWNSKHAPNIKRTMMFRMPHLALVPFLIVEIFVRIREVFLFLLCTLFFIVHVHTMRIAGILLETAFSIHSVLLLTVIVVVCEFREWIVCTQLAYPENWRNREHSECLLFIVLFPCSPFFMILFYC